MTTMKYSEQYNINEENDDESWSYYKIQFHQHWDPEKFLVSEDSFDNQPPRIKELVKDLISFYASGNGLVCDQIIHLINETSNFAQRAFLGEQYSNKGIHARFYMKAITTFFDEKNQEEIFESADDISCIKRKADFIICVDEDMTTTY